MYNKLACILHSTLTQTALCSSRNIHPYWSTRVYVYRIRRVALACSLPVCHIPPQPTMPLYYFVPSELVSNSILACPSECQYRFNSRSSQVLLFCYPIRFYVSCAAPVCCTVQLGVDKTVRLSILVANRIEFRSAVRSVTQQTVQIILDLVQKL